VRWGDVSRLQLLKGADLLTHERHRRDETVDSFQPHSADLLLCLSCSQERVPLNVRVTLYLCLVKHQVVTNVERVLRQTSAFLTSDPAVLPSKK
jgi:hypothetical protein